MRTLTLVMLLAVLPSTLHAGHNDPFEQFNRDVFAFNQSLDRTFLRPVASGYRDHVPPYLRDRVHDFMNNLGDVVVTANGLLQAKPEVVTRGVLRVALNSTFGVLGLLDVAGALGIDRDREDFGQTLAHWGVGEGPYFVLPLLGPATLRHSIGQVGDLFLSPSYYIESATLRWGAYGVYGLDLRTQLLGTEELLDPSLVLDPYVFARESYLQQRRSLARDGRIEDGNAFGDELFDDLDP